MHSLSSSEEEEFMPVGFRALSINPQVQGGSVMVRSVPEEDSDLIPALRYANLLDKAMEILKSTREENVERIKLPLSVIRRSKKTYINVDTIAHLLNRQTEHLSYFISKNLYTTGSINKDGNLVLDGSYLQSEVEKTLRQFIELYVACKICDSVEETYITKENKLFFLCCDRCKGRRCVGNMIEGLVLKDKGKTKLRGLL